MRNPVREDAGQALILVGLAVVILLGSIALGLDSGYGWTQRRVMQNGADAAARAAGKMLAQSVIGVTLPNPGGPSTTFGASQEDVYCMAYDYAITKNTSFQPANATRWIVVEYGTVADPNAPATWTPTWQTSFAPPATPPACPPTTTTPVPSSTRFVRVTADTQYRPLIAAAGFGTGLFRPVGEPTITAGASAVTRLTGTGVAVSGPTWPMVRHYNKDDFTRAPCLNPCDPSLVDPVTFWSSNASDAVYGNFKAAVDFSKYSTYYPYATGSPSNVLQLITQWDQSPLRPDKAQGGCPNQWNALGNQDPTQHDKTCDVPNWFYYTFGGTISVDKAWATSLPAGQSPVTALGPRPGVCPVPAFLYAPSCSGAAGADRLGDRIEVTGGDIGNNYGSQLRDRIEASGKLTPFSDRPVNKNQACQNPGAANEANCYGKALTMLIYLWDCAEDYNNGQWTPLSKNGNPSSDCSQLDKTGNKKFSDGKLGDVNRVHILTAAPYTFYKGLVDTSKIQGFWGGALGDAASCLTCALDPLSNAAYLVGD
ncbi:hypothetical protein BH18CHL2_BH18CHL2_03660 [soil metagenome]